MIARFDGTCARCNGAITKGSEIKWNRKKRGVIYHPVCPDNSGAEFHATNYTEGFDASKQFEREADAQRKYEAKWIESATVAMIQKVYASYGDTDGMRSAMENLTVSEFEAQFPMIYGEYQFNEETKKVEEREESIRKSMTTYMTAEAKEINAMSAKQNGNNGDGLAAMLANALQSHLNTSASVDAEQVRQIVQSELAGIGAIPTRVEIKVSETVTRDMGVQHKMFAQLLTALSAGVNVWLAGPAGSGKTTAAEKCAEALEIPFYFCGAQSNEYGLLGFKTATGETVRTAFREAFENGGIFLFDEVDASASAALLAFNAALANGICAFPDGMIKKHPKFIAIAAANTFGLGGNNDYVGRMKQDAAFLDRFIFMSWEIDEALETSLAGNVAWSGYVQSVRARIRAKAIKVVISPRASIYGAKLIAAGMDLETVKTLTLRKGMDQTQWESVA